MADCGQQAVSREGTETLRVGRLVLRFSTWVEIAACTGSSSDTGATATSHPNPDSAEPTFLS